VKVNGRVISDRKDDTITVKSKEKSDRPGKIMQFHSFDSSPNHAVTDLRRRAIDRFIDPPAGRRQPGRQ